MNHPPPHRPSATRLRRITAAGWVCVGLLGLAEVAAADGAAIPAHPGVPALKIPLPARPPVNQSASEDKEKAQEKAQEKTRDTAQESSKAETGTRGEQLRAAIEKANNATAPASAATRPGVARKPAAESTPPQFTFTVPPDKKAAAASSKPKAHAEASTTPHRNTPPTSDDETQRQYIRARAAALGAFAATPQAAAAVGMRPPARAAGAGPGSINSSKPMSGAPLPWSYTGAAGPLSWGQLKPEFTTCATGQRQSPIAIDDNTALQGPAEPLLIDYKPGTGSVIHTGRTLQVEVLGDNTLTVRGTLYRLERVEFHHPAEERINGKGFAMSAHLLHRSADGQLATVAVLLEPGTASAPIDQIVTYLPLDVDDRVGLPPAGLDLSALLPQDPRYYQFFGSLTTPPCTEDVLWIIFKQPMTVSEGQLKLFSQLFPNNARPLQPANGRVVRAAQ